RPGTPRPGPSRPARSRFPPSPPLPLPARTGGGRGRPSGGCPPGPTPSRPPPPCPPLPPSGPPNGLNFSRRIDTQPCPPSPACTCSTTRSTNVVTDGSFNKTSRSRRAPRTGPCGRKLLRDDVDDLAAALGGEL